MTHYSQRCKESRIDYSFKVAIPEKVPISDYDICIIVGNLLENAVEASQKINGERKILLTIKIHNEQLVLRVENNYETSVQSDDNINKESNGLGLRSVNLVMDRYGGKLLIKQEGNIFTASVLMDLVG